MATAKTKFKEPAPAKKVARVNPADGTVDGEIVTHLVVRSLVPGFRRAGRAWPAADVMVSCDEFTPEQIEQLLAEPTLNVMPTAAPAADASK